MKDGIGFYLIAAVVILGAVMFIAGPQGNHPLLGKPAPDMALNVEGGESMQLSASMKLSDLRGTNIVMLDFWATWCPPCRSSMPAVAEVAREFAEEGVLLFAINQNETPEVVQQFLQDVGLNINVVIDSGWQTARDYSVEAIPQLVLIDKQGIVQAVHVGAGSDLKKRLRAEIEMLLKGDSLVKTDSEKDAAT